MKRGKKVIIAFEGPAGAGKTFLLSHLEQVYGWLVQPKISRLTGRAPGAPEAIFGSLMHDTEKIVDALMRPSRFLAIDRFYLSQRVYGKLRGSIEDRQLKTASSSLTRFLTGIVKELESRGSRDVHLPVLGFVVLLPSVEVLTRQREQSGREYPWKPEEELEAYKLVLSEMGESYPILRLDEANFSKMIGATSRFRLKLFGSTREAGERGKR